MDNSFDLLLSLCLDCFHANQPRSTSSGFVLTMLPLLLPGRTEIKEASEIKKAGIKEASEIKKAGIKAAGVNKQK